MQREAGTSSAVAPGPAFGIGRKLGLVFALLAALLVTIGVVVSMRVSEMHTSVRQVLEEQRESMFAYEIAHALRAIQTNARAYVSASEYAMF
jgi:CHASE3 domain sensor protein